MTYFGFFFSRKGFLRFQTFFLIIACSIFIATFIIVIWPCRNFRISSNFIGADQSLKYDFNSPKYFVDIEIYDLPNANINRFKFYSENNAGKYAEFEVINRPISFENEFRWPPFDLNLRKEVNRALKGQPEEYPRIDHWSKFPVLALPKCPDEREKLSLENTLLIMVRTGAERKEYRNAIRETYGLVKRLKMKDQSHFYFRLVFVMGIGADEVMEGVREEMNKFNDIVVANFEESYYMCTIKFIHAIKFAHQNCFGPINSSFPYVLLIDDNYFFLPWNLAEEARKHDPNEHLYMGGVIGHSVSRNERDKWSVILSEYPFDEYPKFVSGGGVLLSRRTVHEFYLAIQHTQLYIFDDVYTGILAKLLSISLHPNPFFMSDMFSIQIPNSNKTTKLINAQGWWKTVIAAMDFSPKMMREKYTQAVDLLNAN